MRKEFVISTQTGNYASLEYFHNGLDFETEWLGLARKFDTKEEAEAVIDANDWNRNYLYVEEVDNDEQWVISATAPTIHQYNSLRAFGMVIKERGNGSFTAEEVFSTEDEAKDYLTRRAIQYAQTPIEFAEYEKEIEQGYLTLDAVTAYINLN